MLDALRAVEPTYFLPYERLVEALDRGRSSVRGPAPM